MSGHSKWATIKHKKGAKDAARGKLFGKVLRFVEVAAREGGGDPEANPTLATAVAKARDASIPADTIQRAIKRGTGDVEGVTYETVHYEGYGPAGVAVYVSALTDNRNRCAAEVRSTFSKNGGNLGEPGSVAWKFEKKGVVVVPGGAADEERLFELAVDAGAQDVEGGETGFEIRCEPGDLGGVRAALDAAGIAFDSAEVTMLPTTTTAVAEKNAPKVLKLIDALEDVDDVQEVYSDFDISEEILAALG